MLTQEKSLILPPTLGYLRLGGAAGYVRLTDSHGPKHLALGVPPSRLWRDRRIAIALPQSHKRCPCGPVVVTVTERRTRTQSASSSSGRIRILPPRHQHRMGRGDVGIKFTPPTSPHPIRSGRRVCQTHPRWSRAGPGACDHSSYTLDCGPNTPMRFRVFLCWFWSARPLPLANEWPFPYPPPGVAPSRRSSNSCGKITITYSL